MSLVRPLTKTGNFNLLASVVNCDRMATALLTVAVTSDPDRPISFNQVSIQLTLTGLILLQC